MAAHEDKKNHQNEYYTNIYYTTINRQKWTQSHLIKIKATQQYLSIFQEIDIEQMIKENIIKTDLVA